MMYLPHSATDYVPFNRHVWSRVYDPCRAGCLPKIPACYVLFLDHTVIYVGQTLNLRARFYKHKIKRIGENACETRWGDLTGYLTMRVKFGCKYGDWCMREARLIRRFSPKFNLRAV